MIIKGPGGFGIWQQSRDHPNNSIIENGQRLEETCCHSFSIEKPSTYADVKNSNE